MINNWDFNLLFLNIILVGSRTARRRNNTLLHERCQYQNLDEKMLVIFREKSNSKCRDVMQYFVRTLPMKYKIYNIIGILSKSLKSQKRLLKKSVGLLHWPFGL
jgi:hypothetical protein